jgi:RNA polymerase sigma-70 factor (ECF subfamily)
MRPRRINTVHLLVPRRSNGVVQFLFAPHPRWRDAAGRPMLALPAKKFHGRLSAAGQTRRLDDALAGILRDDFGLPDGPAPARQRLGRVQTHLVSPAQRTPTHYSIAPVLARIPAIRHACVARRIQGEWLTPGDALRQEVLSPTARLVLEHSAEVCEALSRPPEPLLGSERNRALTAQLLLAQDGDLDAFGSLLEEMKPHLRALLGGCSWTRALARCADDVEDVLHEAAVRALEHLHIFDPKRGTALAWMWSITRNCAISGLRKQTQAAHFLKEAARTGGWPAGVSLDPAVLAESREELALARTRLATALQAADPIGQLIWQMRFDDGLTYAMIAATLNLPVGTIATWIHRLRKNSQPGRDR